MGGFSDLYRLLLSSLLVFLISGCSLFKAGQHTSKSSRNPDNSTEKSTVTHSSRRTPVDFPAILTEKNIFEQDTTGLVSDSVIYFNTLSFADSILQFSNERLNDDVLVNEIISGSYVSYLLDSLVSLKFFQEDKLLFDRNRLNVYNYPEDYIPGFPDSVYASRIASLDVKTPLELTYNKTVRGFIELYGVRKRALTQRIMGLAELYFPMFEEILDRLGLPLELKYLAVVESALNPLATSPAGARGIWQFMYHTGKRYGLEVNSYVDDRYDPLKSTVAACQHLKDLYEIYQDWWLVLAAYNAGAGNVNKAIRRAGDIRNYWAIWPYLPAETRGYVPAFIAVYYLMNHSAEHNLYPIHPGILYHGVDTVHIKSFLTFEQISAVLGISTENLTYLNPQFKEGVIPATADNPYVLRLPREFAGYFITRESEIYSYKTEKTLEKEKLTPVIQQSAQTKIHTVRSGETLSSIAKKYNTTVASLQSLNKLKGTTIRVGQKLIVQAPASQVSSSTTRSRNNPPDSSHHTVKAGETLGSIASQYNCSVEDLKRWNNLSSDRIYPNQKLIVSNTGAGKTGASPANGNRLIYHEVKEGETLWSISRQYNVTVEDIKRLNNIHDGKSLRIGQKLKIEVRS